jgi:hypothetical protein
MQSNLIGIVLLAALGVPLTGLDKAPPPTLEDARSIVGGEDPCYRCKSECEDGGEACEGPQACTRTQVGEVYACVQTTNSYSSVCDDVGENGIADTCTPGSEPEPCSKTYWDACAGPPAVPSCPTVISTCGTKYTCTLSGATCGEGPQ